jgi:hypothetical protein
MAIGSGNFGKLLDGVQRHFYGLEYKQWDDFYSKMYDVRTSNKAYEESLSFTGFSTIPTKVKGGAVSYEDAKQNWIGRHIHTTYGKGYIVERELWEDAQWNYLKQLPRALAKAIKDTIEVLAATPINNHTTETAADGVAVGSASHVLGGGGTYSNIGPAADLSETSFEQMQIDIAAWVDDAGLKMNARPKLLIVTPTFAYTAAKLLGSDKTPEDANNSINPAKGLVPYIVNPYITDADKWVVITDVPDGLVWYWRRKPEFTQDNDFDTENAKWKTTFRCSNGVDDARGLYINAGT